MLQFLYWLLKDALFFFGMVSGRGSFPRPLSREEEANCIAAMQAGDEGARLQLIEHNLRLVSHIVRKYTVPGYTQDDLVSVGALGLIKAVNTFKPETGSQLSSYAARCIENEVLMLLRASRKHKGDVSLSDPIGTDGEGNDISFIDILGTEGDAWRCQAVSTPRLGMPRITEQAFENPDGSAVDFSRDMLGNVRQSIVPGPFAEIAPGKQRLLVWQL